MKKYILWFSIVYIVCSAIVGGLLIYFDTDANSPSIAIIFISAYVAVQYYIKDHGRALSKSEIWTATWGSWGSSMLITLIVVICIFTYIFFDADGQITFADIETEISNLSISINGLFGIIVFVAILNLGLTRFAYGLSNKIQSKKISGIAKL